MTDLGGFRDSVVLIGLQVGKRSLDNDVFIRVGFLAERLSGFFCGIFVVELPDLLADFCHRIFSSFLWKNVPRKILQENPRQNFHNKSSRHISAEGPRQYLNRCCLGVA